MSARSRRASIAVRRHRPHAPVFAALGDETRLSLVAKLCHGEPRSISELTAEAKVSRQAITKHLRVLEGAGIVRGRRRGRERLFALETTRCYACCIPSTNPSSFRSFRTNLAA